MPERIIDIVNRYAKKNNTTLPEIAETIGISPTELEEKLRKGLLSIELTKSIEDLLGIKEQLRRSSSRYIDLDEKEEETYNALKQAFSGQLQEYCKKYNFTHPITDLAEALDRPRSTVSDWIKRAKIPTLEHVFEIEAVLLEGHEKIKQKGKKYLDQVKNDLMKEFMNYFGKSIKWHCAENEIFVTDFADQLNIGRGTLHGTDTWAPDKQYSSLPSISTYIKVMSAIKGDSKDEIIGPIVNPDKLIKGEYTAQFNPPPEESPDEETSQINNTLDELLAKYNSMDDNHKARFVRNLMQALEPAVEYFRKGNKDAREVLRKVCRARTIELMDTLTLARQILRTEESFQEYLKMNEELYGGK